MNYLTCMETLTSLPDLQIDDLTLRKAALIFRAINHTLRQQILRLIHKNGQMTVTALYVKLRLEQSVASQHLAILRKAKLVATNRDGKFIYYSVDYNRLAEIHGITENLLSHNL